MRRGGRLFIALGAGLALVAIALVLVIFISGGDNEGETTPGESDEELTEVTVIVAARDVPAHTILTAEDVSEQVVTSDVAEGAVRNSLEVIGLAYSVDLIEGQALQESDVELPGLANAIDPGRRAFSLEVTPSQMIGGLVRDEDHIDIIFNVRVVLTRVNPTYPAELPDRLELRDFPDANGVPTVKLQEYGADPIGPTYPYPGEEGSRFLITDIIDGDPSGKLMLQNVRIMRVVKPDPTETGGGEGQNFLILDLDPVEAELAQFLVEFGTFQIVLRSPEDQDIATTPGLTMNMLVDNWGLLPPKTVRMPGAGAQ